MLLLLGAGLATGILPGGGGVLLTVLPVVVAAGAIAATLALRRLARGAEARLTRHGEGVEMGPPRPSTIGHVRWHRCGAAPTQASQATAARRTRGVPGLRPAHLLGELSERVGATPELALIWMAYLIGQLGNWLPVPGGIGGTELGLVGALVLYGFPAPHRDRSRPALPA